LAQLSLAYPRFHQQDFEIAQVSADLLSQARLFFKNYRLAFPFPCDTAKRVYHAYGLCDLGALQSAADTMVSFGTTLARGEFAHTLYASWLDTYASCLGAPRRLAEHGLHEMEQAMFLVDRGGCLQQRRVFGPLDKIPGNDELLRWFAG
jgi:hypothetical protein